MNDSFVADNPVKDSFIPTKRDSFIPDNVTPKESPIFGLINATIDSFKDIPGQIQDLMNIPAALLGTPRPEYVSKMANETIPYLTIPIGDFPILTLSYDDVKTLFQKGKLKYTQSEISPTLLDIAWYATLGGLLAKNQISLARWNMHLDKLIKTEEVRGTVMNNMPAFENLMAQAGVKTEGMDLEAKTNFILSRAKSSPKLGSAIMDLTRGKIMAATPEVTPPIETTIAPETTAMAERGRVLPITTANIIPTAPLIITQPTEGKVEGKPTKEFGFTNQGLYEKVVDFPMEEIPKRSITTPEYRDEDVVATKGKKVTKPIIATIEDINDPESPIEIVDGWHRYRQALANGDKTIPVKLIYKPLSTPTGEEQKPPVEPPTTTEGITPIIPITPKNIKPDISGITPLQKQIQAMEDRKARVEVAQYTLDEIENQRSSLIHRISKYKDKYLKEELTGIPNIFITKEGGVKPDEIMVELRNRGIEINNEAELKDYLINLEQTRKDLIDEIKVNRPELITKRETTLLSDKIKAIETGIRTGKIQARKEIGNIQTELIGMIEESGIDLEDRAKFMRLLKNIQTPNQMKSILPEIIDRLQILRDKAERTEVVTDIKDLFARQPTKGLPIDYKDKIEAVKAMFEPRQLSAKTKAKIESMRQFVERMAEQGEEINIPEEHLALLDKTSLDKLSTEELKDLKNTLERLYHLGRLKNKLLTTQKDRAFDDVIRQGVETITSNKGLNTEEGIIRILKEQNKSLAKKGIEEIKNYFIINMRPELLINMLDNFNPEGINTQVIWNSLWNAQETEMVNTDKNLTKIREVLGSIDMAELIGKKYDIGRFKGMTKDNALAIYAYSLNDKGLARLYNTGITDKDISDISGFLKSNEAKDVETLLKFYDEEQWPAMDAVYSELEGVHLGKEQNYFPMDRVEDISYNKELEKDILERNYIARAGVAKGFTKERVTSSKGFSELSFVGTVLRNLSKVEHYKAFGPAIRDVNKYLNNIEIKQAIIQNFGNKYYEVLSKWLKDVAYGGDKTLRQGLDNFFLWLRTNYVTAMIGINISSMLKAPVSFVQGAEMAGKGTTIKALGDFILHPFNIVDNTEQKSPVIKFRFFNQQRELQEILAERNKLEKITGKSIGWQKIKELSMLPWQIFDKATVTIVWNGAYNGAIKDGMTDTQARDFADKVIRRTQPMAGAINLPDVFRAGVMSKLLTTFRNQQNQNFNLGFEAIAQKAKGKSGWAKLGSNLAFYWLIPAFLIGSIVRRKLPIAKQFAADVLNQAIGGLIFFGNIVNALSTGFMGEMTPAESFIQDIYSAATVKKLKQRIDKILQITAMLTGMPYVGIKRIFTGKPLGGKKKSGEIRFR